MKIKINEFETYEIAIPNSEISNQRFHEILSRLIQVGKMLGKSSSDIVIENSTPTGTRGRYKKRAKQGEAIRLIGAMRNDRQMFVDCLTNYYRLKNTRFVSYFRQRTGIAINVKNDFSSKSLTELKKELNVTAAEIGIVKFPDRGKKVRLVENVENVENANNKETQENISS